MVVYIIFRRGLAALLILGKGQCESLKSGMGGSRNSHAFFVSIDQILLTAEFGSPGGTKKLNRNDPEKNPNNDASRNLHNCVLGTDSYDKESRSGRNAKAFPLIRADRKPVN